MVRVLIVEDEALIGFNLAELLSDAGFSVVGIAANTTTGMNLLTSEGCDIAVLDVNLGLETSAPIAQELIVRRVPFVAVTGYSAEQCPLVFKDAPLVPKPFRIERLLAEMHRCVAPTS
jgi:DNA-binding response OmpR family regulator